MKKKQLFWTLLFLLTISVGLQAATIKEVRKTGDFTKIDVSAGIDVYFTQDNNWKVEVEANDDLISQVITKVDGETLVIKKEDSGSRKWRNQSVKVYVSAPELNAVDASSGSDFNCRELKCKSSFSAKVSSGADIDIDKLTVPGKTSLEASSGSDCDVKDLQTKDCYLGASSGSDIDVHITASGNLEANASSGSDISVSGEVKTVTAKSSSGSDINIKKLKYETIDSSKSSGGDVSR